jgi:hypothetical protein
MMEQDAQEPRAPITNPLLRVGPFERRLWRLSYFDSLNEEDSEYPVRGHRRTLTAPMSSPSEDKYQVVKLSGMVV